MKFPFPYCWLAGNYGSKIYDFFLVLQISLFAHTLFNILFPQKESLFLVAPNFCRDHLLLNVVQFGAILCLQGHRLFECGNFLLLVWCRQIDADLVVALVEFFRLLVCPVIGMTQAFCESNSFNLHIWSQHYYCKKSVNQILLIYVFGFCIIICKNMNCGSLQVL